MVENISFESYKRMIWKRAHKLSKKYNIEWDDIASQGSLIFVKTLKKFDPSKSSFSTYLYHSLRDLDNYCIKNQKNAEVELDYDSLISVNMYLPDIESFKKMLKKVEDNRELSKQSLEMLKYIIEREWEVPGKRPHKVSFSMIAGYFKSKGWVASSVRDCWEELHIWWNTYYLAY